MSQGKAPFAAPNQHVGGNGRYVLHHVKPIQRGGGVYDLGNIVVVTPQYHGEVLDPGYHTGKRTENKSGGENEQGGKMSRDELIRLVKRVMAGEGTESEHDDLVKALEENVPHPRVIGLIYYSDPPLTAEQVVDQALAYRPIAL